MKNRYSWSITFTFLLLFLVSVVGLWAFAGKSSAETAAHSFSVPINFVATEKITAVDFTVEVTGGHLDRVSCGGDNFKKLIENENRCVEYATAGVQSSTLGSVWVTADGPGLLEIKANGLMSTAEGEAPVESRFVGASITIAQNQSQAIEDYQTGDLNGDANVNILDLGILSSFYLKDTIDNDSALELRLADLNHDGKVNIFDLGAFFSHYRS